jgi:hypothetical protein
MRIDERIGRTKLEEGRDGEKREENGLGDG